jgi:hypothetical protein
MAASVAGGVNRGYDADPSFLDTTNLGARANKRRVGACAREQTAGRRLRA